MEGEAIQQGRHGSGGPGHACARLKMDAEVREGGHMSDMEQNWRKRVCYKSMHAPEEELSALLFPKGGIKKEASTNAEYLHAMQPEEFGGNPEHNEVDCADHWGLHPAKTRALKTLGPHSQCQREIRFPPRNVSEL